MTNKKRVLFISPTESVPVVNGRAALHARCEVLIASDPVAGVAEAVARPPDIVVVAGSTVDSLEICGKISQYLPQERLPTFILSRTSEEATEVLISDLHPPEPVSPPKASEKNKPEVLRLPDHGLELDRRRFRARVDQRELVLTHTEFIVLWSMALEPGHVKTRKQLVEACRGTSCIVGRRTMDQHIRAIRHKLRNRADVVETVRGVGYRLREIPAMS
jgi:two-component system phosphate regulon response regulator PhoB